MRIRRATTHDVEVIVALRGLMFDAMGQPPGPADAPWRAAAARWFTEQLGSPGFVTFVAEDARSGVVAAASGLWRSHAPGPGRVDDRVGEVFNVCTDPAHRRRGLARECVTAVVEWLDATAVSSSSLNATEQGMALYESLGYRRSRFPGMRRTRPC